MFVKTNNGQILGRHIFRIRFRGTLCLPKKDGVWGKANIHRLWRLEEAKLRPNSGPCVPRRRKKRLSLQTTKNDSQIIVQDDLVGANLMSE